MEKENNKNKSILPLLVLTVPFLIIGIFAGVSNYYQKKVNISDSKVLAPSNTATAQNDVKKIPAQPSITQTKLTESDHISSYLYAFINTLHSLYQFTQESEIISKQYSSSDQVIQQMTTMIQVDSDFSDASASLQPYINDEDELIQASAKLLYADILLAENANKKIMDEMRTATPDTFNPTQANYDIATLASATETLKNDLFDKKLILIVAKGLIQLPVETNEETGPIKYSVSSSQRQNLIMEIKRTFGTVLDDYKNNTYLLAVKVIQMSLTFDTYEEQKNYKLN